MPRVQLTPEERLIRKRAAHQKWKRNNRALCNIHNRKWRKCQCGCGRRKQNCMEAHPLMTISAKIRKTIYGALKRMNTCKSKKTVQYLGCSLSAFADYYKEKIMIWNILHPNNPITNENVVRDHIKPLHAFKPEEYHLANHYTNIQPIPHAVNAKKSSKWEPVDQFIWETLIFGNGAWRVPYLPQSM